MIRKISLVGSGNVATNLGHGFRAIGLKIEGVYSRTFKNALDLADQIGAKATDNITDIPKSSDLYIISVLDDHIAEMMARLSSHVKAGAILAHTSGSTPVIDIKRSGISSAVFYPLQTFSKQRMIELSKVPFFVSSDDDQTVDKLLDLGDKLNASAHVVSDQERINLHIAAVFTNNFSNHLFRIAEELMKANDLDFDLLRPLLKETLMKLQNDLPSKVQTGPAKRNDQQTIQKHLSMLEENKDYQQLYKLLSDSITAHHHKAKAD
jgi:predicted short-subunit dehydrogenase-like oxidoreductase (DUF2520 family)